MRIAPWKVMLGLSVVLVLLGTILHLDLTGPLELLGGILFLTIFGGLTYIGYRFGRLMRERKEG